MPSVVGLLDGHCFLEKALSTPMRTFHLNCMCTFIHRLSYIIGFFLSQWLVVCMIPYDYFRYPYFTVLLLCLSSPKLELPPSFPFPQSDHLYSAVNRKEGQHGITLRV